MKAAQAIRQMVKASPAWSLNRLGMAMGLTPQGFQNAINRKDMRCGFTSRALDLLGYELVAVPKGGKLPNGAIRIDDEEIGS